MRRAIRFPSIALAASWLATAAVAASDVPPPSVVFKGAVDLPNVVRDASGRDRTLTGLSGITWLDDGRCAAVMDNSDLLVLFRVDLSAAGVPRGVGDVRIVVLGQRHDYEDVAPCPAALERRILDRSRRRRSPPPGRCLLVCEEDTPAIRAVAIDDGRLLGVVPIPAVLARTRPNRGLEALAVDPDGQHIWTANEEALPGDGPAATATAGTVVRLVRIPIPGDESGPAPQPSQFAYPVERPHDFLPLLPGDPLSGVTALVALGGGRLLVLERSGGAGLPPFSNRIALVDTSRSRDVAAIAGGLADRGDLLVAKRILWQDALGCNVEGLCAGPILEDGSRVLLGIADNGGLGTTNRLVAFAAAGLTTP